MPEFVPNSWTPQTVLNELYGNTFPLSGDEKSNKSPIHPGLIVGRYYVPFGYVSGGTGSPGNSLIRYVPIFIPHSCKIETLSFIVTTSGTGNVRLGMYTNNGGIPGYLLGSTGTLSTDTTGLKEGMVNNISCTSGWYWLAYAQDTASLTINTLTSSNSHPSYFIGMHTPTGTFSIGSLAANFSFGSLPADAPLTGLTRTSITPTIFVKIGG